MKLKLKLLALAALAFAGLAPTEARAESSYYVKLTVAKSSGSTGSGSVYASTSTTKGTSDNVTSGDLGENGTVTYYGYAEPDAASYLIGWTDSSSGTSATKGTSNPQGFSLKADQADATHEYKYYAIFGAKYACTLTQPSSGGSIAWASGTSPSPSSGTVYQKPGEQATLKVTATPSSGYEFYQWIVGGSATSDSGTTLTKSVTSATTISATFRQVKTGTLTLGRGKTQQYTGVISYSISDSKVTGSLSGTTLTLTGAATGTTTVTVYTSTTKTTYTVTVRDYYYAKVTLAPVNDGTCGKVWVTKGTTEPSTDQYKTTTDSSTADVSTSGGNYTFYCYALPLDGYVFYKWTLTGGADTLYSESGNTVLSNGATKHAFTHKASTTLNGTSTYARSAVFKKITSGGTKTLVLNGTKTATVAGTLDKVGNTGVATAAQSGSNVVITGVGEGDTTVSVVDGDNYTTYTIAVRSDYSAKATAGVANDSTGRGTVLVNTTQSGSGTYAATSSKTITQAGTAASTFKFYAYASPNSGYGFLGWSDEPAAVVYSGTSPKEISVTSSKSSVPEKKVYAHFGPLFTVTAASSDTTKGTVAITSSSTAASGLVITETQPHTVTATLTATAASGYMFRRWVVVRNGETTYASDNPLAATYDATTTVTAEFKQFTNAGTLYVECGKTVSPGTEFTNVEGVYVTDTSLATAEMDGMRLVVTGCGRAGINDGTKSTTVKVDTAASMTVYTVSVTKPHHEHTFTVGIDEETNCTDVGHEFPTDIELIYSSDVKGLADVYQRGDRVIVRGANRGTQKTDIDAWYFSAHYDINVTKPYEDISISRSIDTYMLPKSAADDTMMTFTNIASVTSSDPSRVTARQVGDNVEITTLGTGTTLVTVDCHAVTYRYTVNVSITSVSEMFKVPLGKSLSSVFAEITSISQNDASKAVVGVQQSGTTVTMTGLQLGSTGFTVVGKLTAGGGYVSKTMNVQVYDDTIGNIEYDQATLNYDGATRVEVLPGGDLLYVFQNPNVLAHFDIPDGYVARAHILAVGGGGGGGTQSKRGNGGGGGGAGGFYEQTNVVLKGGTYYVSVGKGAARHDSKATPVPGNNGGNSVITNAIGLAYANALGGGGGGASLIGNTDGHYGGSGGGSAWYNSVAGAAGQGLNTQGMYGAVPTVLNNGGGGGGASADAVGSAGGAGKASDITGETVVYATGGAGGLADGVGSGAAGTDGLGNGGAGGNGDFGGAGGDGVVVVRLSSVKMYQKVTIPTDGDGYFTSRFVFEENKLVTAFNRSKFETDHPGALAYVDGVIATNCTKTVENGTSVLRGVGYYSFVLYLNDGYTWNDGTTYGTTEGQLFNWRVVLSATSVDATVAVNKSVAWDDENNATITITSHSTPEMSPSYPRVLFMGGLCGAHLLTRDTVIQTLNKVAEKATVDYYLFPDHKSHPASSYSQKDVAGTLQHGTTMSSAQQSAIKDFSGKSGNLDDSNHAVWPSFITTVTNVLKSSYATKYDYVIMEFDGNRLVNNINTDSTNPVLKCARKAAEYLKPYYAENKVMWIVDSKTTKMKDDPFSSNYYVPSTYYELNGNNLIPNDKYALLLCLLDPKAIVNAHTSTYNNKRSDDFGTSNNIRKYANITNYGYEVKTTASIKVGTESQGQSRSWYRNSVNSMTTYYGNVAQLMADIESGIKVVAYNISGYDRVKADVGLTVTSVTVDLATETGAEDVRAVPASAWKEVLRWTPTGGSEITAQGGLLGITQNIEFDPETNEIVYNLTNIVVEAWTKLEIHVLDDGTFKSSVGAVQNPVTGKWEKNPNLGAAEVAFVDEGGNKTAVKGSAETVIPLTFTAHTVSGEAENGQIFLNGMTNNPVSFAEGYNPTVSYRGDPGYWLSELYVDGHLQTINETNMVYVLFRNITEDHHVRAVYESVVGTVTATPVTKTYDRVVAVPTVTLGDDWRVDDPANVKIVYAWSENAPTNEWKTAEEWVATANPTDAQVGVGTKTVYYRVMLNQPGWGEEGSDDSWGWKVVKSGSSTVKINKAALTVSALGQSIKTGDPIPNKGSEGVLISGLVGGDTEATALKGTYNFTSQDYKPATSPAGLYHILPGGKTSDNYEVTYVEGLLAVGTSPIYVNDVPQASFLKPAATGVAPVEEVYDGTQYGLTVNVTQPTSGITTYWSADDAKTWSLEQPTYTDAGTYKVWYKVTDGGVSYITASNYQYVTILPREVTLTSASATKMFDGEPLTKNVVTMTEGTLANGETFTYNTISRITEVGTLDNDFKYSFSSDVEGNSNYSVKKVLGHLAVTPARVSVNGVLQPDNPDPKQRLDQESNGVEPVNAVYNGEGTNLVIHVLKPETGAHIRYTTTPEDPSSWREDLLFTNVTDVAVWYSIEDPAGNYAPVTNFQFVTITPRPATVTAGSDTKVYDGTPLICTTIAKVENMVAGDGIASMTPTAESFQTDVGTGANNIASVTPAAGTDLTNYTLTYLPGELVVTKRAVTLRSPTKTSVYQSGQSFSFLASEIEAEGLVEGEVFNYSNFASIGGEVGYVSATFTASDGSAKLANYDITYDYGTLILGDATMFIGGVKQEPGLDPDDPSVDTGVDPVDTVYDGASHPLVVEVTYPDRDIAESTVKFSLDNGATWKPLEELDFTNVRGKSKVWYCVEAPNFTSVTNYSYVTIRPRAASVTAGSATKVYDGAPLTSAAFSNDGFLAGQGAADVQMTDASTRTNVGLTSNVIASVTSWLSGTSASNYTITYVRGTLTVTPAPTHPDVPEINRPYDGTTSMFEVTVPSGEIANPTILYSTDGGKTFSSTPPDFTNAGKFPVVYVVEDPTGNHAAVTNETTVTITHREITVKVNPAQMRDGEAEPTYTATVTCNDNGEALEETELAKISYHIGPTGSLKVGQNTLHASGEEYQDNYHITYVDNVLTIYDKLTIPYTVSGSPVVYDGYAHGITVTVDSSVPSPTVKYSLYENGDYTTSLEPVTNVSQDGGTPIWFTITSTSTYQPVKSVAILKVVPRPVTVTADDKSKAKDQPDPVLTATVANLAVPDQGKTDLIAYTLSREAGEDVDTYAITPTGETEQGNYTVTYVPGTLTIGAKTISIDNKPQDPSSLPTPPLATNTAANATGVKNVVKTYDGTDYSITVTVTDPASGATVLYSADNGATWSLTNPTFTHFGTNKVWYAVSAPDYAAVTNYGWVVINKKKVRIYADSATKVYDGTPLTQPNWYVSTSKSYKFIGEEGIESLSMTEKSTRTKVGATSNKVDTATVQWKSNTSKADYKVTYYQGALTITAAPVEVGGKTQDPTQEGGLPKPGAAGTTGDAETGVNNVYKVYDGQATNIVVNVTKPSLGATVLYSSDNGKTVLTESPSFTDVGTNKVWYAVTAPNYAAITNYAWVVIDPRPATVTADNKTKEYGQADPALTVTVTGLVGSDTVTNAISRAPGEAYGDYAITPTGDARQGNYTVTYEPGKLTITHEGVKSLWICDHEDAGGNKVHLAFKPERTQGEVTAEFVKRLDADNRILVVCGAAEDALTSAVPTVVHLRDAKTLPDLDKGWIWVTIDVSGHLDVPACLWKILIAK